MSSFLSYALFYTFFYLAFLPRGLCEGGGGGSSGNAYMYGGEGAKFTGLSLMTYRPLHNCFVMSSLYWISLFVLPILPGQSDISCFHSWAQRKLSPLSSLNILLSSNGPLLS